MYHIYIAPFPDHCSPKGALQVCYPDHRDTSWQGACGFESGSPGPEASVLPIDHPPHKFYRNKRHMNILKYCRDAKLIDNVEARFTIRSNTPGT